MKKILITKEKLKDKYPFKVSPVYIKKDSIGGLYMFYKNVKYNLNGVATKGIDIDPIWLDDPEIKGAKISLSSVFNICRDRE